MFQEWLIKTLPLFLLVAVVTPMSNQVYGEKEFRVRGQIHCLDSEGNRKDCSDETIQFAIQADGKLYKFLPEDNKSGIFRDSRVRERLIEVVGWPRDENYIEIIQVFVQEGIDLESVQVEFPDER